MRSSAGKSGTEFNYTGGYPLGGKNAGTGLLFYNARYYDPALARFVQADSLVPNTSHRALTVDVHEISFIGAVAGENTQGFWLQLSKKQRQQATAPWGPGNPQELNRYAYVNNNPLKYTDPSGHCGTSGFWATAKAVLSGSCVMTGLRLAKNGRTPGDKLLGVTVAGLAFVGRSAAYASGGAFVYAGGVWIGGRFVTQGLGSINVDTIKLSTTVSNHLNDLTKTGDKARPYTDSRLLMQEIMRSGPPIVDPGGLPSGLRWDVAGSFRGSQGIWQLVIDTKTNTVVHFLFKSTK